VRHVKRLPYALKKHGDKAVVHGLRNQPSNRRIAKSIEESAVGILSPPVYKGFGPKLAAEYLGKKHGIEASKETVRQWMIGAKLWRANQERVKQVHIWRPRRSRFAAAGRHHLDSIVAAIGHVNVVLRIRGDAVRCRELIRAGTVCTN
jgi:hypothetical protein